MDIDGLRRVISADPGNTEAITELLIRRSHVEGRQVFLEPFLDIRLWCVSPIAVQDIAIEEAKKRLEREFKFVHTKVWECDNVSEYNNKYSDRPKANMIASFLADTIGEDLNKISYSTRLATFKHLKTGIEMNLLPGRDFNKEGTVNVNGTIDYLTGVIDITIGHRYLRPFLIGRSPVTTITGDLSLLPVTGMSFSEVISYLSSFPALRLPTELEWQYAQAARTSTRFYWGDEVDDRYCWHAGNSGRVERGPAGPYEQRRCRLCGAENRWSVCYRCVPSDSTPRPHPPREHDKAGCWSSFGLVDMIGNVEEYLSCNRLIGCNSSTPPHRLGNAPIQQVVPMKFVGFRVAADLPIG